MASSIRVDEDFTIEVIEEVEDEDEKIIKTEPHSDDEWEIDPKIKEEIDFEDNYVDLNQYVNLEAIKTEIKSETDLCSDKSIEKFELKNVPEIPKKSKEIATPRITLNIPKLTIQLNLNLGQRETKLRSILVRKPKAVQKYNKNVYFQNKPRRFHNNVSRFRNRPNYHRFNFRNNNQRFVRSTNTYHNREIVSYNFEQTYNQVLNMLNQILINQNVQFNTQPLLWNYNNYNLGYVNLGGLMPYQWPHIDLVNASGQLLFAQILALLNQLNNNAVQTLLNNFILNVLGFNNN